MLKIHSNLVSKVQKDKPTATGVMEVMSGHDVIYRHRVKIIDYLIKHLFNELRLPEITFIEISPQGTFLPSLSTIGEKLFIWECKTA